MRVFFAVFLCIFVFNSTAIAGEIPPVSRRSFIRSISICLAATLIPFDHATTSRLRWAMHPEFDIETLGLESFGNSVKELLLKEGFSDSEQAEKLRWNLQAEVWRRLEPRTALDRPSQTSLIVAVRTRGNRYLYFNPHFRIEPLTHAEAGVPERTIGKIKYVSDTEDFRVLTYWKDGAPDDPKVVRLEL